jgi:hypothetical protein
LSESSILEVSFEIPSSAGIFGGSSAIGGLSVKFSAGWWPPDRLLMVNWPLDGISKADREIGIFSAADGSLEVAPSVGGPI